MKPSELVPILRRWSARHIGEIGAGLMALGWFVYLGFAPTLVPTFVSWLFRGDWSAYHWGFSFSRNASWSFPLGVVPDLFYPYGTSVAFTDANPWLAILFRLLSPLLPEYFQFFGFWFLLCYVLQAVFGARLTAAFTDDPIRRALGGALFALTPILPARNVHIALCGIFFLTAALSQALSPASDKASAKARVIASLWLLAWAAGTHGYLSAMLLVLSVALYAQLWLTDKLLAAPEFALAVVAAFLTTLGVYFLFGYLGWRELELGVEGFGDFSADLLTLVNSQGWSHLVPALSFRPRQHEGFAYLGLGVLLLLLVRLVLTLKAPRRAAPVLRRLWPLLAAVAAMAFYSLSSRVTLRGEQVWDLSSLYAPWRSLTDIFRSSGRFVWPLHLLLVAAAVSGAAAIRSHFAGRALLLAAVLLQAVEFDPSRLDFSSVELRPLRDPVWNTVGQDYRHMELVPIHVLWVCRYDRKFVDRLSGQAYRSKLTFNSGNVMRRPPGIRELCERHFPAERPLDARTIYVVDRKYLRDFRGRNAVCGTLEGLHLCVDAGRDTALVRALQKEPITL